MRVRKRLLISAFSMGLTGLVCAQAEISRIDPNAVDIPAAASKVAPSSIYIVQMKGDPVVSYEGDVAGYKATKPGKGRKVNPKSTHVRNYAAYLEAEQDQAIKSVGADKVYNYRYSMNGFAARMTEADAAALRRRGDVVNVWKDEIRQLQTDGSPAYIGLTKGSEAWSKGYVGEDIVIGVVDSGIWPEHPSFADVPTHKKGNKAKLIPYGPIPPGFTSSGCDFGSETPMDSAFSCNNKLVSARCFNMGFSSGPDADNLCGGDGIDNDPNDFQSARDDDGHGSHTASTAGGNNGVPAEINGEFLGKISGIAPRARIAAYKACWTGGCAGSDTAAAIDQAVADGVDVINYSVGSDSTYFAGPDDIAFLFAADAGVFVATSNGNSGPGAQTTGTPAGVPWITAVGATQDNGAFYDAASVNTPASIEGEYVAVEGDGPVSLSDTGTITGDVTLASTVTACDVDGAIDTISGIALVSRGVCSFAEKYNNAATAGAAAIIVYNDGTAADRMDPIEMSAPDTTIPGVMVSNADGLLMAGESGVNVALIPNAISAVNRIADFSSRGPNGGAPDVIKPDVSAPGVAILAAASPAAGGELFMSISGTSMASPHVAGAFALLKQAHPDWSPAIARSALMTTARQDLKKSFGEDAADPFDIGAGEILPSDANDPGLAYDAGLFDYAAFTCENNVQLFSDASCDVLKDLGFPTDGSDLNLASIGIAELVGTQTITRTVTSVANDRGKKTYTVSVDAPPGIDISVSPSTIKLKPGESASYEVTFTVTGNATLDEWVFGSLSWSHTPKRFARNPRAKAAKQSVRSPIAVHPVAFSTAA